MNEILERAEPFFFPRSEVGCLLIHGFTGTPFEMREMGEYLAACGFSSIGVRLFGHATVKEDLYRVRRQDWVASVEDAYQILAGVASHFFVIGLSMGSLLAIKLSSYFSVQGLVLISAPYYSPDPRLKTVAPYLPYLKALYRSYPKSDSHWDDPQAAASHIEYDSYPLQGIQEVGTLLNEARQLLPRLSLPTLLFHSTQDRSVGYDHAQRIMDALGSPSKRLVTLERSAHNVPRDSEKRSVFGQTASFIRQVLEGSAV